MPTNAKKKFLRLFRARRQQPLKIPRGTLPAIASAVPTYLARNLLGSYLVASQKKLKNLLQLSDLSPIV